MVYLYPTCSLTDSNQMQSALEQTLSWAGEAYWADNSKWAPAESKVIRVENITFCYLFFSKKNLQTHEVSWMLKSGLWKSTQVCWGWKHCMVLIIAKDKGQLISKCLFGIFNSPIKWTKKFDFTTMVTQVVLFLFVFWEKWRHHNLEIYWPLVIAIFLLAKDFILIVWYSKFSYYLFIK